MERMAWQVGRHSSVVVTQSPACQRSSQVLYTTRTLGALASIGTRPSLHCLRSEVER